MDDPEEEGEEGGGEQEQKLKEQEETIRSFSFVEVAFIEEIGLKVFCDDSAPVACTRMFWISKHIAAPQPGMLTFTWTRFRRDFRRAINNRQEQNKRGNGSVCDFSLAREHQGPVSLRPTMVTCSHTSPRHSPTMVTLHDTRFVECRWWNDGWTVKTVVT